MLGLIISRSRSTFRVLGLRSRSLSLFLEKLCQCSNAYIYWSILIWLHTNVGYDIILSKFDFQGPGLKVKVTVAIFRKTFSMLLRLHLLMDFNITTQMLGMITSQASFVIRVLGSRSRSLWLFLEKLIYLVPTFIDGFSYNFTQMFGMIISWASSSFRVLDSSGYSKKNFLTVAVIIKNMSFLQHLHLQIDFCEGICIACETLFKDHMYTCQWSDTGPPEPLVL